VFTGEYYGVFLAIWEGVVVLEEFIDIFVDISPISNIKNVKMFSS
jgi:hypothetical protein